MKKAQYMSERIGEEFDGIISGVTAWGIYVELPNTVEGLVRVSAMQDGFYYYNESSYQMIGQSTGKEYKLGDKIRVYVREVDTFLKTIDFGIVPESDERN